MSNTTVSGFALRAALVGLLVLIAGGYAATWAHGPAYDTATRCHIANGEHWCETP